MKTIVPVVTAIVFALALMPASAATKHKRHTQPAAAPQQQIACAVVGCMPVPRGCHAEMGYTPWGTPTGFDVMACPNYTLCGLFGSVSQIAESSIRSALYPTKCRQKYIVS